MIYKIIIFFFNFLHFLIGVLPIFFGLIPESILKKYLIWYFLIIIFIPLHWIFCNGECLLTLFTRYFGDFKDSNFIEKYGNIFYNPIKKLFNIKKMNSQIMLVNHLIIIILITWYYLCFKYYG